jgi:hypothetical protein
LPIGEQGATEPVVLVAHARQREEEATAHGLDVLLQWFALQACLHGQEAPQQAALEGGEQQSLVEAPGAVEAA